MHSHAACHQLTLPGLDAAVAPLFQPDAIPTGGRRLAGYMLFLALFPECHEAHRLGGVAAGLRRQHGLGGTPLRPSRLHITLHSIAHFGDTIPQAAVDAALAASARVNCPPLPIVFDRVLSFAESQAFVLRCDADSDAAIAPLRASLGGALRQSGLHPQPSSTPHMTMLYDPRRIDEHPIVPIRWTATRFALVLSNVGAGHHQWIAQWSMKDRG